MLKVRAYFKGNPSLDYSNNEYHLNIHIEMERQPNVISILIKVNKELCKLGGRPCIYSTTDLFFHNWVVYDIEHIKGGIDEETESRILPQFITQIRNLKLNNLI